MSWGDAKRDYPEFDWFALMIAGAVMLLAGSGCAVHTWIFLHNAIRAEGKVLNLQHLSGDEAKTSAPTFRFVAENGNSYTVESNKFRYPPEFEIGQNVPVLYSRAAPENARIDTFWQIWATESVLGLVGSFFVIAPSVKIWWSRRRSFRR